MTNEKQRHRDQAAIRRRLNEAHRRDGLPEFSYYRALTRLFEWGLYTRDEPLKPLELAYITAAHDTETALARVCQALEALEVNGYVTRTHRSELPHAQRYRIVNAAGTPQEATSQ